MSYYDEPNIKEECSDTRKTRRLGKKKGYFFTSLVGFIVGAALITLIKLYIPWVLDNERAIPSPLTSNSKVEETAIPAMNNETDLLDMIEGAKQVVVGVINIQKSTDPFTIEHIGDEQEAGSGSGIIYKKYKNKAYIITNSHVVNEANKLIVKLNNNKQIDAKLVGQDPWLDLAVIEIDGSDIHKVATLGNSSKIRAGQSVIAIGSPLGFENSVTKGIISSKEREIPVDINGDNHVDWQAQVIQTDAAINRGNSGGALFNQNGEVIGINSSKIATKAVEGISFAIPINLAIPVIESLEKEGTVKRPVLGGDVVSLDRLQKHPMNQLKLPKDITNGVVLKEINAISPAEQAGLQKSDIVVALDEQPIQNTLQFRKYLYEQKQVGDKIEVTFYRNGEKMRKTAILADNPATSK